MKKINYVIAALSALAIVFSCAKEKDTVVNEEVAAQETAGQITISATISDALTKVGFAPTYSSGKPTEMALTWATDDQIRVYNHADRSEYQDFTLVPADNGKKEGHFTGTPISASSYDVEVINSAFDYAHQTQPSDGNTTGLKYLASATDIADYDDITFTSFSSVLAITAKMPSSDVAAKIKSVDITASDNIFNGGNTLTITLGTIGDAGADGILHLFATLPQGNQAIAAGTTLLVHFNAPGETHNVYTRFIELPATTFTNNKLNTININATNSASYANASTTNIGKSTNPYLIGDKFQLAAISDELSTTETMYFKLVDDITVSSWKNIDCDSKGTIDLDGNGKDITGLDAPLFSFLDGRVSNLTLSDAEISASGSYYGVLARAVTEEKSCDLSNVSVINGSLTAVGVIGGLVGRIDSSSDCTLTNCSADVDVTGTAYYVAGLVGRITKGTVSHCSATGNASTSTHYASGLIGQVNGTVTVEKCYATENIITTANSTANHGGIVAHTVAAANLTVQNCYYTGHMGTDTFKTRRWCGGILGATTAGSTISVTNCYSNFTIDSANINLEGALVGNNQSTGLTCSGFVGWSTLANLRGANTAVSADGNYLGTEGSIYSQAVALGGWDFVNVWTTDATPVLR